ncbi:unnamed protein product [Kuraishia capsulata CBS 1993]|uniref:Phosphatidic acid phosphatase type 2/haloperoxidase domain-containing protein n=1 Tax=Kuraishia capsulata CBS 1993 TaxID=1382522 RepID=W6MMW4_9ASCO|nr:uncharacterized protein KUCA_T00002313001 [Kuraishia capsulata CBS 1993]CDK26342.1 unnamed protein product [Kuraishia capsulata CBS 1993]
MLSPVQVVQRLYDEFITWKRSGQALGSFLTSKDPRPVINGYKLSKLEIAHYSFIASVFFFVLCVLDISIFFKLAAVAVLGTLVAMPITGQFFLHGLPVLAWVALFFSSGKIPHSWKPPISVKVLPSMETILYGDNLSDLLAATTNRVLDLFAWFPYGIIHFSGPFIVAGLTFIFGPPTAVRSYAFAFGYMNLIGVIIQNMFPAAPPWYKLLHGLEPANYDMNGSPGGLGRIDDFFGFDMYTTTFSNAPVVFGAFPSLHSGCASMDALFLMYLFPSMTPLWCAYVCWLWWSTMYLTHHYFFDLTAGATMALTFFSYVKYTSLPIINPKCFCRFSYTSISKFDIHGNDPLAPVFYQMPLDQLDEEAGVNAPFDEAFELSSLSSRQTTSQKSSRTPSPPNHSKSAPARAATPVSAGDSTTTSLFDERTDLQTSTSSASLQASLK